MPVPVDIVLPCYNPHENWTSELVDFNQVVSDQYSVNYIVVNDGSFPGNKIEEQVSALIKSGINARYISYQKNMGKGYALRQGIAASKSDFVVYTDIDFPFTPKSTSELIKILTGGNFDVVAGYRDARYYQKKMSGFRKVLSKAFRFFIGSVLKMKVSDTQCGLKGFNRKGKEKFLETRINRYLFDFEFIYFSSRDEELKIYPVLVQLKDNVVFSKMRFKIIVQETINLLSILLFRKK